MFTPTFENLESRTLKSADLRSGVLTIDGTDRRDVIAVKEVTRAGVEKTVVTMNGKSQSFLASKVRSLKVTARKGNDTIDIASSVTAPAVVNAGAGNDNVSAATFDENDEEMVFLPEDELDERAITDFVYGGDGSDTITGDLVRLVAYGERGDDEIFGSMTSDCIYGGEGDDIIDADFGDDEIFGGFDDDTIYGGDGDDQLDGDEGDDDIFGQDGDDDMDGGYGDDTENGGEGDDDLTGDYGNDHLYGQDGFDTIKDLFGFNDIWQD